MRTCRSFTLILLFLLGGARSTLASSDEIAGRIDAYIAPLVEAGHFSGSVLVARGDDTLYERSFGLANRELEVPVGPETRFCVGSLTKPMTRIIALQLFEAGVLTPADRLAKWIPDFPQGADITVGMLLEHRAGLPHRVTTDLQETVPQTAADMVELAKSTEFLFKPGSDTAYSSPGYSVLARVLELATGKGYADLVAKYVFTKTGMTDSLHPTGHSLIPNRASSYYLAGDGELINSPLKNYSFLVGAGSVFSTPRDLVRLMRAVVDGVFGKRVKEDLVNAEGIDWNGLFGGYRSFADYHANSRVYVTLVSNVPTGAIDLLRRDLPRLATGEEVGLPTIPRHRAVFVDPDLLRRYEGDYQLFPGRALTLTVEGGEVRLSGWLLIPTSETSFFSPQDYAEIAVVMHEDGSVERLDWNNHPMPRVTDDPKD